MNNDHYTIHCILTLSVALKENERKDSLSNRGYLEPRQRNAHKAESLQRLKNQESNEHINPKMKQAGSDRSLDKIENFEDFDDDVYEDVDIPVIQTIQQPN